MKSGKSNLEIDKNSDYSVTFECFEDDGSELDLTGYEAVFIARKRNDLSSEILLVADEIFILNNIVQVDLSSATSKSVGAESGYYNLILSINSKKYRTIEGNIFLTRTIDDS